MCEQEPIVTPNNKTILVSTDIVGLAQPYLMTINDLPNPWQSFPATPKGLLEEVYYIYQQELPHFHGIEVVTVRANKKIPLILSHLPKTEI